MSEETFAVQLQCQLQSRKQRHKRPSEVGEDPAVVRNYVAATNEQKLKLGDLLLIESKLAEVRPHPRLG